MHTLIQVFGVALVLSWIGTPLVRRLSRRWGIVDHPDDHRKLHHNATPLGGGVAVLFAFAMAVVVILAGSPAWRERLLQHSPYLIGMFAGAVVICMVGLIDDRFGLRGRQKLVGQLIAAAILVSSGLMIEKIQIFDWNIQLGVLAIPFTLFWLLGATNALNLLDGIDGLATSVGIVLSLSIAVMALLCDHREDAILAVALAGALVGFLFFNSPPASIFLGDAGSMLIGLMLGALAIHCSLKSAATVALVAPTAIWAIPIMDVGMAIARRKLTGRSIYTTDRSHLHHTLLRRGLSGPQTVVTVGMLCMITGISAVISVYWRNEFLAVGAVVAVVAVLMIAQVFGHQEGLLLLRRIKQLASSILPRNKQHNKTRGSSPFHVRIQGSHRWDELWETLTRFGERFDLSSIQLNVSVPSIHEEYHATWERRSHPPEEKLWISDIPLLYGEKSVGRLRISGPCNNHSVCAWMGDLIAGLKPFETHMLQMIDDAVVARETKEQPPSETSEIPSSALEDDSAVST